MKTYTSKNLSSTIHQYVTDRQAANYERFIQGKAGAFQVAGAKDQAMFWMLRSR